MSNKYSLRTFGIREGREKSQVLEMAAKLRKGILCVCWGES